MKKTILKKIGVWAMALSLGISLTGCLQPSTYPAEPVSTEVQSVVNPSSETVSDIGEPLPDVSDAPIDEDPEQIRMLFDSYLNGGDKIFMNTENSIYLKNGESYDCNEFIDAINASLAESYEAGEEVMTVQTVDFAEIDCGNDGIPEMALYLTIDFDEPRIAEQEIYIAKVIDGKITVVDGYSFGYRSFGELNKYGVFHNGGSGGANLYVDGYKLVSAEGKPEFLYEMEMTSGLERPLISKYDLPQGYPEDYPEEQFEPGGFICYEYAFEPYPGESDGKDKLFEDYAKSKIYVFATEEDEVTYPSDELMDLYKKLGMTVADFPAASAKIDERKAELGVTDEMMINPEDDSKYAPSWRMIYEKNITEGQGGEN